MARPQRAARLPRAGVAFVALLVLAAGLRGSAAECVLRLDVAPQTQLKFAGSSSASLMPGAFEVSLAEGEAGAPPPITLQGPLFLAAPGAAKCPRTQREWAAAAAAPGGLVLTSAPSGYHYKPLAVSPPLLPLSVMGVPLNISALELNVTLRSAGNSPSAAAAGNGERLAFGVNASIVQGYVYSNTPLTGGPQLQPLGTAVSSSTTPARLNLTAPGGGSVAAAGGPAQQLNIVLPDFKVTFEGKTYGVAGGKPWSGSLTFSLSGPLYLSGLVNCPTDCGSFGRCVAVNGSSSSTTAARSTKQYACECECGWSVDPNTGRCEAPGGTCPLFPSDGAGGPLMLAGSNTSSRNSAAGGGSSAGCSSDAVAATGGSCPAKYGFDFVTKTCKSCDDGWGGAGCKQCATDEACKAKLGTSQAVCTTGMLYNERSQNKFYSCSLTDPSMAKIVGPVLPLSCSTGAAKPGGSALAVSDASLAGTTATCSIALRLLGMPAGASASCVATGCAFAAGSPSFECSGVVCDCTNGCPPAYTKTFKDVHGTVTVNCDTTGADCTIVIGSLNMKIKTSCEASECLDPAGPKTVGAGSDHHRGPPVGPPLIAALPLLVLLVAGLVCAAALLKYRRYLTSKHHGRSSSGGAGKGSTAAAAPAGSNGGDKQALRQAGAATNGNTATHVHSPSRLQAVALPGPVGEGREQPAAGGSGSSSGGAADEGSSATTSASGDITHAVVASPTTSSPGKPPLSAGGVGVLSAGGANAAATPGLSPLIGSRASMRISSSSGSGSSCQIQELAFYDVTADVRVARSWRQFAASALPSRSQRGGASSSSSGAAAGVSGDMEQGGMRMSKSAAAMPSAADVAATQDDCGGLEQQLQLQVQQPRPGAADEAASAQPGRWRRVLQGVSGCVGSGEVLGIMGPSGGGKSTLLMKLCGGLGGHARGGEWRSSGLVCLDGVAAPPSLLTAVTALVPQDDTLMRSLTVEECIRYSAALRLDPALPPAAVNARVEGVMDSLGLTKIRRSTVLSGTGVSGVSGGERRRVAIAMELVIDPQVLVLDEPLSGLDSYTALQLMRSLQAVADSGRVVALSLHQPSPALFGALDNAMLLAGGVLVYSGPPHAAAAALAGLGCPVPPGITVAEHLLHVVSDPASLKHVIAAAAAQQQRQSEARRAGLTLMHSAAQPQQKQKQQQQHDQQAVLAAHAYPPIKTSLVSRDTTAASEGGGFWRGAAAGGGSTAGGSEADASKHLARELSAHASRQQYPAHLQSAAAAAAASLGTNGLAAGPDACSNKGGSQAGAHASGAGAGPLSPKLSWWQRVVGGGAQPAQQQQQQTDAFSHHLSAHYQQQQQPLSPKPSWYQRISAPKPLKGGRSTAATKQQQQQAAVSSAAARFAAGGPIAAGNTGAASVGGHSSSKAARLALGLPKQRRPFFRQVGVLFWRGLLDMLRNPLLTAFHALGGLVLGLLVGVIFYGVKSDTSGAQNRVGAIFFALCLLAFTSVTSVDLVQAEANAAGREMQRRYYTPVAYALTKLVLDGLLLRALPALLFGLPFYFLMGLNAAVVQVLVFLLVLIAFSATVGALALGFASSLDSPGKTILVMNLVLLLGVLFGGFLANKGSIPVWLRWISWLSVFRYAWEALVINELSNLDLFLSAPGVALSLPVKGQVFLQVIGVDSTLFLPDIAVLVAMYGASCIFVTAVLAWKHRVRNE